MTAAPSLYDAYKARTMHGLTFPLKAEDNRPIYDASGRLVSITEHAKVFAAAINFTHQCATILEPSDSVEPRALLLAISDEARRAIGMEPA